MRLKTASAGVMTPEFDFRSSSWGMSKRDVRYSEDISPQSEGDGYITYRKEVMGLDTIVGFHFLEGSLVEAGYAFRESFQTEHMYRSEYERVKDILTVKYGEPSVEGDLADICCDGLGCEDSECDDSFAYLSEWLTSRSIIRLVLIGGDEGFEFGVLHRSREHAHEIMKNQAGLN